MKKKLLGLLAGAAAVVASVQSVNAQGYVTLDNYSSGGPQITYLGSPAPNTFTVGLYYALGNQVGNVPADATGVAIPGGPLALATGGGATVQIAGSGYFFSIDPFAVPGSTPGSVATFSIVAYNGADYASSLIRGHSSAFTVTLGTSTAVPAVITGNSMPGFAVQAVPEPSAFALAGLGSAAMLIFRRRK